jgi:hypothetical protein
MYGGSVHNGGDLHSTHLSSLHWYVRDEGTYLKIGSVEKVSDMEAN